MTETKRGLQKHTLLRAFILFYSLLNLLYYFLPLFPLHVVNCVLILAILALSLGNLPKSSLIAVGALLLLSAGLMIYSRADMRSWMDALTRNGLLTALFTFGNLLHIPFRFNTYQMELKNVAKLYMHSILTFHLMVSIPTHTFAAITGFATLGIMYHLFHETSNLYKADDEFIATLVRSYASSGFWGTSWVSVMLVVQELHIPWPRLILLAIPFTVTAFAINLASLKLRMLRSPGCYPTLKPDSDTVVDWRKIIIMATMILIIVGTTLVANLITGWSLLAIVPLVSLIFPPLAALVQRKGQRYREELKDFGQVGLFRSRTNVCLFTAAGLLAHALDISGVGEAIGQLIPSFLTRWPALMAMAIMLLIIIPGQLGIHPVAIGTTLVTTINPAAVGLTVPSFALAIICGWLLSNMTSPFSAINLTMSGITGKNSWYTGLKLNWRYSLVCLVTFGFMIPWLSPLLGNPV